MKDLSGQPPSDKDIEEAIEAVEAGMVKYMTQLPPPLAVQLGNIHRCLKELQKRRADE